MTGNPLRSRRTLTPLVTGLAALTICAVCAGAASASPGADQAGAVAATYLNSVSCPAPGNCWAVGRHTHTLGQPVVAVERLSGGTWSAVPAPTPAGAVNAELFGVSCVSARDCWAVGGYAPSATTNFPFAEQWNGTRWSLVKVPHPAGSTVANILGITCTSAGNCWAVGQFNGGTMAEHWTGSAWSVQASPGGARAVLLSVACARAADCWAVGFAQGTLTLHWNGSAWSQVTTPTSRQSGSTLGGVSCPGGPVCLAVGSSVKGILAQRWNGSVWSFVTEGGPTRPSVLFGDACVPGPACMAVGTSGTGPQSEVTLAARWQGTTWSELASPNPTNWLINGLRGVACSTAADCWAVGGSLSPGAPGSERSIIEHWNGTAWLLVH